MRYLTRNEMIAMIQEACPAVKRNTINSYIQKRIIKPSRIKRLGKIQRVALFSDAYVEQIIGCAEYRAVINWDKVKEIKP